MCTEGNISNSITEEFIAAENFIWMVNFHDIYLKIIELLPPRNLSFSNLPLNDIIGCEIICAAIAIKSIGIFLGRPFMRGLFEIVHGFHLIIYQNLQLPM